MTIYIIPLNLFLCYNTGYIIFSKLFYCHPLKILKKKNNVMIVSDNMASVSKVLCCETTSVFRCVSEQLTTGRQGGDEYNLFLYKTQKEER